MGVTHALGSGKAGAWETCEECGLAKSCGVFVGLQALVKVMEGNTQTPKLHLNCSGLSTVQAVSMESNLVCAAAVVVWVLLQVKLHTVLLMRNCW